MKPGDIILIQFPQTNLQAGKLRPALIVATAPGNHPDHLLALITSQVHQAIAKFDEVIDPSDPDYRASGLKVQSVVRLARLTTVEESVITARLGTISPTRLATIRQRLANWLK